MDREPRTIPIDSPDDPRIELFRNVKDRDLVGRRGVFIAESELVVRRLITQSPLTTLALLLNPTRLESMAETLARLAPGTPVYVAPQVVFDQIAGFHIHRGVLAIGKRPDPEPVDSFLESRPPRSIVLALEDLTNHDNLGGIFRCAAALGAAGVICTERCADPLYRKATRVSIGATLTVPFTRAASALEMITALHNHGYTSVALTPNESADEIDEWLQREHALDRVALLLGAEGPGLSRAAMAAARRRVRIGRMVGADSLNVAVAAGIALHACRRRK